MHRKLVFNWLARWTGYHIPEKQDATSALVDKDFALIISNKTRHCKMAARAVHNKNHMTQEMEETLKGLYRYYSYVQLNM